jgi:hypothetical protein
MATHDYVIDNALAAAFRTDLNNALQAIVSGNSGTADPATMYANMIQYRTDTNLLRKRNEANSAWITLGTVDEALSKFIPNQDLATSADVITGTDATKPVTVNNLKSTVNLGTFVTTSGTTVTLSSLDLTTFRELHLSFAGVSSTATSNLTLAGQQISGSATAAQLHNGFGFIDLISGVCAFNITPLAGAAPSTGLSTPYSGNLNILQATTSIVLGCSAGTFDAGSVKLIGHR